jgi:segregation and condensation protein B
VLEALLFLSSDPVPVADLAEATGASGEEVSAALQELRQAYAPGQRGLLLRELAGGFTLSTDPSTEPAARRLLAKPRIPPLTPAQAEVLAIVAYLQPVSRPEMTRIRGVSSDSATATLLERGLIEEAGRSQFGAVLYRTTELFLKLFGLSALDQLPDVARWDPSPQETAALRERLLRAGDARAGNVQPGGSPETGTADSGPGGELAAGGVDIAPPGEAHGGPQAVSLQRGAEGGDSLAP